MRILLLNYEYPPLGGGAGIATRALASTLGRRGQRVDVVTSAPPDVPGASLAGAPTSRTGRLRVERVGPNVDVHYLALRTPRKSLHEASMQETAEYVWRAAPVVRRLLAEHRYTAVHCFFSLPTGALLPLARRAGVGTVVSLRGSDVPGYDRTGRALRVAHRVLRPATRWIWRTADQLVALSGGLAGLARSVDPDVDIAVIGNGVDLETFHPSNGSKPRDGEDGRVQCLAVSRLVKRKNLDVLLRALARLRLDRYRLTIVGSGPEEGALRALARRLSVSDAVTFTGARSHEQTARLYREADVFVLTPSAEAFGNAFSEAIASGLPVVANPVGCVADLVRHGENGLLVEPDDPEGIATAIDRLGRDASLRRAMSHRNRRTAEDRLTWAGVADRYTAIYRAVDRSAPGDVQKGAQ